MSDMTDFEKELLRSYSAEGPSDAAKGRVVSAGVAVLGGGVLAAGSAGAASAATAGQGTALGAGTVGGAGTVAGAGTVGGAGTVAGAGASMAPKAIAAFAFGKWALVGGLALSAAGGGAMLLRNQVRAPVASSPSTQRGDSLALADSANKTSSLEKQDAPAKPEVAPESVRHEGTFSELPNAADLPLAPKSGGSNEGTPHEAARTTKPLDSVRLGGQSSRLGDQSARLGDQSSRLGDQSSRLGDQSSRLGDEVALLDRARASLGAGDAASALAALDLYDKGRSQTLAREAELVRLEALVAAKHLSAAEELGHRIVRAEPAGAHAATARRILLAAGLALP